MTREEKVRTVIEVQTALHGLVDTASISELRQALHDVITHHNHLTCMYCSIAPLDCDFMGLVMEGLTARQSVPESLSALDSKRLCRQCRLPLDNIDGLFCTDCVD